MFTSCRAAPTWIKTQKQKVLFEIDKSITHHTLVATVGGKLATVTKQNTHKTYNKTEADDHTLVVSIIYLFVCYAAQFPIAHLFIAIGHFSSGFCLCTIAPRVKSVLEIQISC